MGGTIGKLCAASSEWMGVYIYMLDAADRNNAERKYTRFDLVVNEFNFFFFFQLISRIRKTNWFCFPSETMPQLAWIKENNLVCARARFMAFYIYCCIIIGADAGEVFFRCYIYIRARNSRIDVMACHSNLNIIGKSKGNHYSWYWLNNIRKQRNDEQIYCIRPLFNNSNRKVENKIKRSLL